MKNRLLELNQCSAWHFILALDCGTLVPGASVHSASTVSSYIVISYPYPSPRQYTLLLSPNDFIGDKSFRNSSAVSRLCSRVAHHGQINLSPYHSVQHAMPYVSKSLDTQSSHGFILHHIHRNLQLYPLLPKDRLEQITIQFYSQGRMSSLIRWPSFWSSSLFSNSMQEGHNFEYTKKGPFVTSSYSCHLR